MKERVKVRENRILTRERSVRAGAWGRKGGLHSEGKQVPTRRERASKRNLPRRSRRKYVRVSGRKSLQVDLQSLGFTRSLAKREMRKAVG